MTSEEAAELAADLERSGWDINEHGVKSLFATIAAQAAEIKRIRAGQHDEALQRLEDKYPDMVEIYESEAEWAAALGDKLADANDRITRLEVDLDTQAAKVERLKAIIANSGELAGLRSDDLLGGIGTIEGVEVVESAPQSHSEVPTVDELAGIAPWYGEATPGWLDAPDGPGWWLRYNWRFSILQILELVEIDGGFMCEILDLSGRTGGEFEAPKGPRWKDDRWLRITKPQPPSEA